jgi:hypothetical protein
MRPWLPNSNLLTTSSNPNDSPISPPRGQQLPSAGGSMQNPNQLGRPPPYTYAPPDQQLGASPPMDARPHSSMPSPPVNTQQSATYPPQQIYGAPPQSPPGPPNFSRPQHGSSPATPQPTAPYRPRGLVQADAGAKDRTQLIVGIDFVCPG